MLTKTNNYSTCITLIGMVTISTMPCNSYKPKKHAIQGRTHPFDSRPIKKETKIRAIKKGYNFYLGLSLFLASMVSFSISYIFTQENMQGLGRNLEIQLSRAETAHFIVCGTLSSWPLFVICPHIALFYVHKMPR